MAAFRESIRVRWMGMTLMLVLAMGTGCQNLRREKVPPSPIEVLDLDSPADSLNPLSAEELRSAAEQIRLARKPAQTPERTYNVLVLSGGGIFGAYSAGVMVGWTESGDRPNFDVITGISTGGLIAAVSFLGPEYDWLLRELYTTVRNKDIFTIRPPLRALSSDSIADTTPMAERLRRIVTPEMLQRVAAEHAKGRRLYIGTTNLPNRRLVVWDMGAIATRGTLESEALFEDLLLASSAVPGFFPPVRIAVDVDGTPYEELHVDGGVSRSMFFRPPYIPPSQREGFGPTSLYGSNLYVLVAGKVYSDSDGVRPKPLAIASGAINSLLYSQARGDIDRLYHYSTLTGMNFHLSAIPPDFRMPNQSLKFDPEEMTRLFEEGRNSARERRVWRDTPPVLDRSEELRARTGTRLTRDPSLNLEQSVATPSIHGPAPRSGIPPTIRPIQK